MAAVTAEAEEVDEGGGIGRWVRVRRRAPGRQRVVATTPVWPRASSAKLDGLEHGQLGKQRGTLECAPEAQLSPPSRGNPAHITPQEHHSPGGRKIPTNGVHDGGLPRSVRPDQSDDFTTLDPD